MTQPSPASASPASFLKRWLPLALLAIAAVAVYASGAHQWLSLEAVAANKSRMQMFVGEHFAQALALYMTAYITITALSIPGALIMTIVGGLLFPFWIAAFAVVTSATLGATLLFLTARTSLGASLKSWGGERMVKLEQGLKADAASYLLFLRLVPAFPFALVNLAPAFMGVGLKTFVWTTFVGIMPGSLAFVLAASSLNGVIDDQQAAFEACKAAGQANCRLVLDLSALVSRKLLLAFAAIGVIALIPVVARRIFARSKATTSPTRAEEGKRD